MDLGNETVERLLTKGVKVRQVRLLATEHGATDFGVVTRLAQLEMHGVERPDGFRFAESIDGKGLYGLYRFPVSYTGPAGAPVAMLCSLGCEVAYQITPTLFLRYELLNINRQPVTPAWIEVDRAVRAIVMSWINGG